MDSPCSSKERESEEIEGDKTGTCSRKYYDSVYAQVAASRIEVSQIRIEQVRTH